MKVLDKKEKRNDLLKRTEYDYAIKHPSSKTPSKAELQAFVSKDAGVEAERVDIRKVYSRKGMPVTDLKVFVWDEKKVRDLNKKEPETKEEPAEGKEEPDEKQAESASENA